MKPKSDKPLHDMRSPLWPALRKTIIAKHPFCAACGCTTELNVHHKIPFHIDPTQELVEANCIVLGEACPGANCHYRLGHLNSWNAYNLTVEEDAAEMLAKIHNRKTK